jgi:hypothetical protein
MTLSIDKDRLIMKSRTVILTLLLILFTPGIAFPLAARAATNLPVQNTEYPRALQTIISVDLKNVPLKRALADIAKAGNFQLNYSDNAIPVDQLVSVTMVNVPAITALREVMEQTRTELIISSGGDIIIVPVKSSKGSHQGAIKGYVIDAVTQRPLAGANILLLNGTKGASSDALGAFAISDIPVGSYSIQCSYVGYQPVSQADIVVKSSQSAFLKIALHEQAFEGAPVTVTAGFFAEELQTPTSMISLSAEHLRRAPGAAGDLNRALSSLPAFTRKRDDMNEWIVRGGSPSESGFYIDNIEFTNINHLPFQGTGAGFIGLINVDMLQQAQLYTGGFSARYGNRLSSILDISFREGNRDRVSSHLDLNLIGTGGIIEGPLANGRGSWLLSARKSTIEMLFRMMDIQDDYPEYSDIQSKLVYDLTPNQTLSFLNIFGTDRFRIDQERAIDSWENFFGTLKMTYNTAGMNWQYRWNGNGFSNTSLSHTFTRHNIDLTELLRNDTFFDNKTDEHAYRLRNVNTYRVTPSQTLQFGIDAKFFSTYYNNFYNEATDLVGNHTEAMYLKKTFYTAEGGGFFCYDWKPVQRLTLSPSIRFDHYTYTNNTHISPRFSSSFKLTGSTILHGSTGIFYQQIPMILLAQQDAFKKLRDPVSRHYILGLSQFLSDDIRFNIEVYQKSYNHFPLDPTQPSLFIMDQPVYEGFYLNHSTLVDEGTAYSRGIELMLQKKMSDKLYGTASTTWFRSRYRDAAGLRRNRAYDNRYMASVDLGFKPTPSIEISARWISSGGMPYTPYNWESSRDNQAGIIQTDAIHTGRLKAYHGLHVRLEHRANFAQSNLTAYLEIWNVLNRENLDTYDWNDRANSDMAGSGIERAPILGFEFEF